MVVTQYSSKGNLIRETRVKTDLIICFIPAYSVEFITFFDEIKLNFRRNRVKYGTKREQNWDEQRIGLRRM